MGRDDPQFNLRLPYELKEKLKQRAKSNGRSLNAELVQIVTEAISKPSPVSGYRDEAERIADEQSELVKKMVFDTLKSLYKKPGFAPIFPDTCYHLTHYWPAAVDIPVASDNPVHYADAIRYNARTPLQGSLLPLTRLV